MTYLYSLYGQNININKYIYIYIYVCVCVCVCVSVCIHSIPKASFCCVVDALIY